MNSMGAALVIQALTTGRVLVAGAGIAGAGVGRMLAALGCRFTIVDDDEDRGTELASSVGAHWAPVTAATNLLVDTDLLITSPGWRPDSPLLLAAAKVGVPVIGDIDAAWLVDQAGFFGEPRTWLAVTGTNGKTTTTAMLAAILATDGRAVAAVGNIGTPPGDALLAAPRVDVLAAEVSSFQLHWAPHFQPNAGVILNLAEDHLDWHGSFSAYAADKARVFTGAMPILAIDDAIVLRSAIQGGILQRPHRAVTLKDPTIDPSGNPTGAILGTGVRDGQIVDVDMVSGVTTVLAAATGISPAGPAGLFDAVTAAALARVAGATPDAIAEALLNFSVDAHRGQVVSVIDGVEWVDNSKATNPHAAEAALRGLHSVIWVAGGQLKGAAVDALLDAIAPSVKAAVLIGVDRMVLADGLAAIAPKTPVKVIDDVDPESAMATAVAAARDLAQPGDTVVLAPAAASLDMYAGMSQRGDLFSLYASGVPVVDSAGSEGGSDE